MEKKQERVLAYGLSTEIRDSDIQEVSGGVANMSRIVTWYYSGEKTGGHMAKDIDYDL
ncbi:hypothetical protein [Legionella spiritensis]|uniref:Uncharacterized protein n=1 Tax=Legionella spiritensis TaxID=452 RepID=A0A0W0YYH7_LEGSP|nr:hypothetical protein [Legionella spiritensis]KTD61695.1 hypothetical protein Lspi_2325 [Legionella spiritensis]SNV38899.1 Uncharacterised protein [Legionella spiritensis]VEG90293.1 Uncharacterised protein [Legionella spiritensis]